MKLSAIFNQVDKQPSPRYIKSLNARIEEEITKIAKILGQIEPNFIFEATKEVRNAIKSQIDRGIIDNHTSYSVIGQIESLQDKYGDILAYFLGQPSSLDHRKSLYVYGGVGSGKTTMINCFRIYTRNILKCNSFKSVAMSQIIKDCNTDGIEALEKYVSYNGKMIALHIEDFGIGQMIVKNWGTNINVIEELIDRRYRLWKRENKPTHICSNIQMSDLNVHFDKRVVSRIHEMCNDVDFNIIDFRKL